MLFAEAIIPLVQIVKLKEHGDDRDFDSEVYN
jgi:hypothetical protein